MLERHIHLDAAGGLAGDMAVAALVDAFPEMRGRVLADIAAVLPAAIAAPEFREGKTEGLRALRFGTLQASGPRQAIDRSGHFHPHADEHDGDGTGQPAHHDNGQCGGEARSFREMVERIRRARLASGTADHAVAILTLIAEVEAAIHQVAIDAVELHEIADWDSLIDVVAAGSLAAALGPATWSISELPRGGGLVRTRHGFLPVPAPATASLLLGFKWRDDGIGGERVTPTGAAILRHLVGADGARLRSPAGRLAAIGTGAGTCNLPGMPNVLRALVFERDAEMDSDVVAVLSFDIDDMTGEEIAVAAQRLRALPGVLDLSVGARCGKKGRILSDIRLLVDPVERERVAAACFLETSTLGLRWRLESRAVLPRQAVITAGVRAKQATRPGGEVTVKAESDDLAGGSLAARRASKARVETYRAADPGAAEPHHGR